RADYWITSGCVIAPTLFWHGRVLLPHSVPETRPDVFSMIPPALALAHLLSVEASMWRGRQRLHRRPRQIFWAPSKNLSHPSYRGGVPIRDVPFLGEQTGSAQNAR